MSNSPRRVALPAPDQVHVWRIPLDSASVDLPGLIGTLSSDERARADRFRVPSDRASYVLTRAAARELLADYCGIAPAMLAFDYGPAGKPRLAGHDGPRFNISHSGTLAVIAVARVEVGIDVECRNAPVPDVPPGVFAAIEAREIQSADDPLVAFYDTWTRKEALVKAMGAGLGESIANLVVRRSGGVTIGGFHVQTLNVGEGYSAALAAECGGSESPPNIIIRSWTQTERWTLDSGCWSGSSP